MNKKKVLIGSPVYQKPEVLKAFLTSLKRLSRNTISIDYMFINDNVDANSTRLLSEFRREGSTVTINRGQEYGEYLCDEDSHHWDDSLMFKVATYKNSIINYAAENNYDYLLFVDSDLVLHPSLIEHLMGVNKDIVSEIFWSQWRTGQPFEPNVWLFDEYDLVPKKLGEKLSEKEIDVRKNEFLQQLKVPGIYEVGGLGACTLISRAALMSGVNFQPIKNLTIHGEDRFFCIRAAVLGIKLYVDTHYPAYHIYREQDLLGVQNYINDCQLDLAFVRQYKEQANKITLSMIVRNEGERYLSRVLDSLRGHIDKAVIIDDGSSDNTVAICRELLKGIPLHIIKNEKSMFVNEVELRKKQWGETIKTNPDWILNLDADEIIEDGFWNKALKLVNDKKYDIYSFRLYDMWDETHYREDEFWHAHDIYRPFLMRYQPKFNYKWNAAPQHCGRFPVNTFLLPAATTEFRIKHFGWAKSKDRIEKLKRYQLLDPGSLYGMQAQYDSIMDINPCLLMWQEKGTQ